HHHKSGVRCYGRAEEGLRWIDRILSFSPMSSNTSVAVSAGGSAGSSGSAVSAAVSAAGSAAGSAAAGSAATGSAAPESAAAAAASSAKRKRKNLSDSDREAVLRTLLGCSRDGKVPRGDFEVVGEKFGTTRHTTSRLWKRYQAELALGESNPSVSCRRKGNAGRKPKDLEPFKEGLKQVPLTARTTQRAMAKAIGLPPRTMRRHMTELGIRPTTRFLKPLLRDAGKIERLHWARRWVTTVPGGSRKFKGMANVVCVDEKWFYLCKDKQRYYLLENEPDPSRKVQHKSHIMKVMFLGAVTRPRRNTTTNTHFDGKIGLYPFTEQVRAQRSSRNLRAGALETKCVELTKERYKRMMLDHVIPDIKRRFPRPPAAASGEDRIVWLQQDNARPHLINNDPELRAAMSADGWDIRFINQPPNSPDTNILDLGFFNSIQSLQDRTEPRTVDQLISAVKDAWQAVTPVVLNRVWLSLQACLQETMLAGGDNDYKIPHLHKEKLENAGTLPWQLACSEEAWTKSETSLAELNARLAGGGAA
ncbi:unnamed protein product, partial [Scytosiphon promiscuus]